MPLGRSAACPQPCHDAWRGQAVDFEAHQSGRQIVIRGRVQPDMAHRHQTFFELPIERMHTGGDASSADLEVQLECLGERPAVFERMKAAGRVQAAW